MRNGSYSYGRITKCVAARIYQKPTIQSNLVGTVSKGTEVMIVDGVTPGQYFSQVITPSGIHGYCMSVFIEVIAQRKSQPEPEPEQIEE